MKKNHLIIIGVVLVVAVFVFWFRTNYEIVKIEDTPSVTPPTQEQVNEIQYTNQPGLDPKTESKGPTYPPPSY